jgi:hypothetical protein
VISECTRKVITRTYVNTSTDETRSRDAAGKVLGILVVGSKFSLLRESEGDLDGTILDVVGVSDLNIAASQGGVEANSGPPVGQRELESGAGDVRDGSADDGVHLHMLVHL